MGPRRYRRGCVPAAATWFASAFWLQWGRDVTVADVAKVVLAECDAVKALQWGRDVTVADVGTSDDSTCASASSFNGAATLPSRMYTRREAGHNCFPVLQWGRDVTVADVQSAHVRALSVGRASMGPRRYRRGCPWSRWRRCSSTRTLQWGRDVTVADVRGVPTHRRRPSRFNGAATLPSRMFPFERASHVGTWTLQWGRDVTVADVAKTAL